MARRTMLYAAGNYDSGPSEAVAPVIVERGLPVGGIVLWALLAAAVAFSGAMTLRRKSQ